MAAKKHLRIWLTGGETGGHVMPLLAVAEVLGHSPHVTITYIGSKYGPEAKLARAAGLKFISVPTGKLRRYFSFRAIALNLIDSIAVIAGTLKSCYLISRRRPNLIFSKGGPVALPVALAAYIMRVPLITHESDAVMGVANRFMARFAARVLTAFPASYYPASIANKVIVVGLPIRQAFCSGKTTSPRPQRILITGGIQGAQAINRAVAGILPNLLKKTEVVHITGAGSYKEFMAIKSQLPKDLAERYTVLDFTPDIAEHMRHSSLVLSRASSAIFEIASMGKPMVLIPLPNAANNHQVKNAEIFASHNAAVVIRQENLTPNILYEKIVTVLEDKILQQKLREGTRQFSCCESAAQVMELLKQYAV